jgi:hypothetical protein
MAQQTDLAVRIATIFDEAGIKKADKAVNKLQRSTVKLGKSLGLALGTVALAAYGKKAAQAFIEDQKAIIKLNNAVKNLGLSFAQANIDDFISKLEKSSAIADDILRPAFQSLLTTTGSVTEAQKLLTTAIEASRGSGYDLATTSADLAKAYVGNTRGLQKYYLGLSKTQLASMKFEEIQAKINKTFEGANKAYLNTAAGKMEALSLATGNFTETVGGALINSIITLSGSNGIEGLIEKIDGAAQAMVRFFEQAERTGFILRYTFNPKNIFKGADEFERQLQAFTLAQQMRGALAFDPANNAVTGYKRDKKAEQDAKKAAALQARLLKQSLDSQKKLTAEQKKQAALKKAGTIFDLEQIQIIAALQGNLSKEEQTRLKAQLALLNNNEAAATSLTKQILMSQDATGNLYKLWQTLPDAKNPFAYLEGYLDMLAGKAAALFANQNAVVAVAPPVTGAGGSQFGPGPYLFPSTNVAPMPAPSYNSAAAANRYSDSTGPIQVSVNIDGKQIASSLQDSSMSGIPSSVNRTYGSFAGR